MKKAAATIGLSILLAACGGGGSDSTPAPPTTAEGFWTGTASSGASVAVAVLDNGETWGLYGSGGAIVGGLYGNTTYSGSTLSGSGLDFNIGARTVSAGTYSGTFDAKSTISVTASDGSKFTGTYSAEYDQPASLNAVAGTFSGQGVSGTSPVQTVSVTITPTGDFATPPSAACTASGTIKPRASGKNVFDVTVTFTGPSCALGDGASTRGIGYYDASNQSLWVMAVNAGKTDGFIYVGSK